MKKIFFLSLLGLFFFAGCKNTSNISNIQKTIYPKTEQTKSFESILPKSIKKYNDTKPVISIGTGEMLAEITSKVKNEISRTSNKEEKENGRKESVVSGYIYTYIYQDLGLKISTPPLYPPYFFEKETGFILKRNNAIVYSSRSSDQGAEYIQIFMKEPSLPLQSVIEQNHLSTGCVAHNMMREGYNFKSSWFLDHSWKDVDLENFFSISDQEGSLGSENICHPDKDFPQNQGLIYFVQSQYHNDRYYKISLFDGCAPGPCSIFGKIEFF